ncbi:domain of Kin17 curved DNA-binding protein-domain-containing protein [Phycomyces blakesleeanus]|uniref:Domain of Kin17 curved DNA-binding protein-domain-containing protein n=1 Tax=Phycomyces blakesleeanus TaxID=4837 RepID=A0ABR3AU83_PHYBL
MSKGGGFLTPKSIANRIKAKGLTKLKFYCQVCEKACRDANGFKCHITSESHQRQMLLVAANPGRYIHSFSDQFKQDFLSVLSHSHGTKRMFANQVYQEYIADRNHLHMNATRWTSLSEFVKHLGREGICHVEETERGWYITWIDNSPKALERQAAIQKLERMQKDDEDREQKHLKEQMERASKQAEERGEEEQHVSELKRVDDGKIKLNLSLKPVTTDVAEPIKGNGESMKKLGGLKKKGLSSLAKAPTVSSPVKPTVILGSPFGKRKINPTSEESVIKKSCTIKAE